MWSPNSPFIKKEKITWLLLFLLHQIQISSLKREEYPQEYNQVGHLNLLTTQGEKKRKVFNLMATNFVLMLDCERQLVTTIFYFILLGDLVATQSVRHWTVMHDSVTTNYLVWKLSGHQVILKLDCERKLGGHQVGVFFCLETQWPLCHFNVELQRMTQWPPNLCFLLGDHLVATRWSQHQTMKDHLMATK